MSSRYMSSVSLCLVIFVLSANFINLSRANSPVSSLPGLEGPLPFDLETGYVGVGDSASNQMFYYFVKSERNPNEDPLILWLTGGPGCSGLNAVIFAMGPIRLKEENFFNGAPLLTLNPYSWTKIANIIFLDAPVGTGFSYSNTSKRLQHSDTSYAKDVCEFMRKWLIEHPEFLSNPLYIGGDSYAGMIVPIVVQEISIGKEMTDKALFNLQGYILGNPVTDKNVDYNAKVPFAHGMGLISDELYKEIKDSCGGNYLHPCNEECALNMEVMNECLSGVHEFNILEPDCGPDPLNSEEIPRYRRTLEGASKLVIPPPTPCKEIYLLNLLSFWANDIGVMDSLHVRKGTIAEWKRCNRHLLYLFDVPSAIGYHLNISRKGYRSLIYSGDHDLSVPFVGTQSWIRSLNFPVVHDWHAWVVDGQIAGYTRTYSNNMTFATVKGAGHIAGRHEARAMLSLFMKWISHQPL